MGTFPSESLLLRYGPDVVELQHLRLVSERIRGELDSVDMPLEQLFPPV